MRNEIKQKPGCVNYQWQYFIFMKTIFQKMHVNTAMGMIKSRSKLSSL